MLPSLKEAIGFSSDPLPDQSGYTWTLTTRLGQFLSEAERLFGPRDLEWTPLGIEFCGTTPQIWYPGNKKFVSIMLTDSARTNPAQALFQLAHEVVHLLSPLGCRGAPVLEEGIATWFSDGQSIKMQLGLYTDIKSYLDAKRLVEELMLLDINAIAKIRMIEAKFYKITPEIIRAAVPGASEKLTTELCSPFNRGA